MSDKYEGLSDEELKEIFEDMQAGYWVDYYKSNLNNESGLWCSD